MAKRIENNCVGPCPMGCIHCGRQHEVVWECDSCGDYIDYDGVLYKADNEELCEECLLDSLTQKECDDMDDTRCALCGDEAETLYLVDDEWLCKECALDQFEKVDLEGE